jgi:hypothetical protein
VLRFEQRPYFEIENPQDSDFLIQLQFDLCVRKLAVQGNHAVPAYGLQPTAAQSVCVLDEKQWLRTRIIPSGNHLFCHARISPHDAAGKQIRKGESVFSPNLHVEEITLVLLGN